MNETLKEFVHNNWVKQYKAPQTRSEDIQILHNAGFEIIARNQLREHNQSQVMHELVGKHILLKTPPFQHKAVYSPRMIKVFMGIVVCNILLVLACFAEPIISVFLVFNMCFIFLVDAGNRRFNIVKLGFDKFLYSAEPDEFTGHVPTAIAKTVLDYQKQGFKSPRIWGIATRQELFGLVKSKVTDPLLVFSTKGLRDYDVLAAVWGEDIEKLDEIFS